MLFRLYRRKVATQIIDLLRALALLSLGIISGCVTVEEVAPWDRGYLAEAGMQWDLSSRDAKLEGHVYTSKEASSGGTGSAGGGCGCN
ncbi:MAG: DUF4266 domain-containing protein [Luminiphilus sp.]|jgi:hypothetical protein|nr:DUF4266 domain-containing protein [Luminiphilus sp.]